MSDLGTSLPYFKIRSWLVIFGAVLFHRCSGQLDFTIDSDLKHFLGTLEPYEQTANEVVFVLDESGSIEAHNWPQVKLFTELMARQLSVSADASRIGIMTFATSPRVHVNYIKNSKGKNMCTLLEDIEKIDYVGEWTYTDVALKTAKEFYLQARSNANKILILITDGRSNDNHSPVQIAKQLKEDGVIIFAVGVADINEEELQAVATSKDHIYILRNFQYIYNATNYLRQETKEVKWDHIQDTSMCNSFCTAGVDCCDVHADCYCGTKGGNYECTCKAGYFGLGHKGQCKSCPKGTFKDEEGVKKCVTCPENSTTTFEGTTTLTKCICKPGYHGNPSRGEPCKPVECEKLQAPEGGVLLPLNCGHTYSSQCSFKCNEGYCPNICNHTEFSTNKGIFPWNLQPEEPRLCLETGSWTGTGFYCEKIRCPALNFPINGNHNCTGLHEAFTFNTTCELSCAKGYDLIGSNIRTCLIDGVWSGEETFCKAVMCDKLKINERLKVKPAKCGNEKMPYLSTCQHYCKEGFQLSSYKSKNTTLGIRKCLANMKWSGEEENVICKDIFHPKITCPSGDFTFKTDHGQPNCLVNWVVPVAFDNVGVSEVRIIHPPKVRKPPYPFPIGQTKVVYEAIDVSKLRETCSFTVTVIDLEPPQIESCPLDIEVFHDKRTSIPVTWDEPVFVDNSGSISSRFHDRKSGDPFQWGPPSRVKYVATDASGNKAFCTFNVKVKPYPCPYAEPPANGFLACDNWADGRFCQVSCSEGYAFTEVPENLYYCKQENRKWGRLLGKNLVPVKFPWPDCSKILSATAINITFGMTFSVSNCSDTDESIQKIKEKFIQSIMVYNKKIGGFCAKERGCEVKNVNITCGSQNQTFNLRQKKDISISSLQLFHNQSYAEHEHKRVRPFSATNPTNGHHLRHTRSRRSASSPSVHIVFNIEATQDEANIFAPVNNSCENCNGTSGEFSEEVIEIFRDYAEGLKDILTNDANEVLKDSSPVPQSVIYSIVPICQLGQIVINDSCVNCPVGTYFNSSVKRCVECPLGSFQDEEGSLFCNACPNGTSTLNLQSKHSDDCKAPCQLGTFSDTGMEPCISCPKNKYQDDLGSTECKVCLYGLKTSTIGSNSLKDCVDLCQPGSYSSNGYQPCDKCSLGMYQPDKQQTSCLPCPKGATTTSLGAHTVQYCRSVQFCEEFHPCYEGSTCINEDNGYECICEEGRVGKNCDIDVDDCSSDLCFNGGTCVDGLNNFTCVCPTGFSGFQCDVNIDDCISGPCKNGGNCTDLINDYACVCPEGLTGKNCEINFNDCSVNPCKNNGTCFDKRNGFRCFCTEEFTGPTCEVTKNNCEHQPCTNGGTCHSNSGGFLCNCPSGFAGKTCEDNIDECTNDYCQNGGTCIDDINHARCHCPLFYTGSLCEEALSAEYGVSFPSPVTSNYIALRNTKILFAITVSFFMKTSYIDQKNKGTPISYSYHDLESDTTQDNALTLTDMTKLVLYIHGQSFHTGYVPNSDSNWHHYAVTWDNLYGQWALYVDARRIANGTDVGQGQYLWPGMFVLGQEQDSIGGSFSTSEAFVGDITQFNVWDYAMTSEEIKQLSSACSFVGNLIRWPSSRLNIQGDVSVINDVDLCKTIGICSNNSCNCMHSKLPVDKICKTAVPSCATNPCANNQKCVDQNQASFCDCESGYDGRFCQYDVNECLMNKGNCSHLCRNTPGSYECTCPVGMVLKEDGRTCKDSSFCKIGEQIYLDGETWTSSCHKCRCYLGDIICIEQSCPNITCSKHEVEILLPENCCLSCVKQSPMCIIQPNNSFTTFDSKNYEFEGNCRYTLAEDCFDGLFTIHLELDRSNSSQKHLTILVNSLKVRISPGGLTDVNANRVELPFKNDEVEIKLGKSSLIVTATPGFTVFWHNSGFVAVTVPQSFKKRMCGLCGNFNGDLIDDQITKQNMPARTASEFIHSWKVEGYKYCFTSLPSTKLQSNNLPSQVKVPKFSASKLKSTHSALSACGGLSSSNHLRILKAINFCNVLKKEIFRRCHRSVNPKPYYLSCLQDACSCKANEPCFCDSVSAYVTECQRKNIIISDWNIHNMCGIQCSGGMVYDDCGPACPRTCFNSGTSGNSCSRSACIVGCHCPANTVLHNGHCIRRQDCPLFGHL